MSQNATASGGEFRKTKFFFKKDRDIKVNYELNGMWNVELGDGSTYEMLLPGTLDENKIGYKDDGSNQKHPDDGLGNIGTIDVDAPIATRLTRKYTYEGVAKLTKRVSGNEFKGKRVFLDIERGRSVRLFINEVEASCFQEASISTPYIFEITDLVSDEMDVTIMADNSYPNLPREAILFSSAATDQSQTNWNGILGFFRLRTQEDTFLSDIRVYPNDKKLLVEVDVSSRTSFQGVLKLSTPAIKEDVQIDIVADTGITTFIIADLPCVDDVKLWDEYEGNLYELTATLQSGDSKKVTFGVRDFGANDEGRLALNGRTIFLRGEANSAVFPETGHPPMDVIQWRGILESYKSYGMNCVRFHSWCPPKAAFIAADEVGMLMQPELSHWGPKEAFESDESYQYYQRELRQIILTYANHPSFVMLTFGNELCSSAKGHKRMEHMLDNAKQLDGTRLYANGSNVHYGQVECSGKSNFYTSSHLFDRHFRGALCGNGTPTGQIDGHINNEYPSAARSFDAEMAYLRESYAGPMFGFEVGQSQVLPDFDELADFRGISDPINYELIKEKVVAMGLLSQWKRYVEASGELSLLAYREEVEAVLRTKDMSGLSLLGIQDFPGQGTALVGMMNAHLQPKPFDFAKPEAFRAFFRSQLPLACLPKYTYESSEHLMAEIKIANYGKATMTGPILYELKGKDILISGEMEECSCPIGGLTSVGSLDIPLKNIEKSMRLDLTITMAKTSNIYPIWVYAPVVPTCPQTVYEIQKLDERAKQILDAGGTVYLSPASTKEQLPQSIKAQFTTDFWSVGTFSRQAGGMGQLIDSTHPIFDDFPTENHSNWQWWVMASQRAIILPEYMPTIITEMDSYSYLRPMTKMMECRVGNGKLLLSSMGLQDLQEYPEARALLFSIYTYLASEQFNPAQVIDIETIAALVV